MLPGFMNPFLAGGLSVSMVASATVSGSSTITAPNGIQKGDVLVLWDDGYGSASAIPTGFTQVCNINAAEHTIASYKVAAGNESGTVLQGMNPGGSRTKLLYVFRGNRPIEGVTLRGLNYEAKNGTPAAQTIAASARPAPLILIAGMCALLGFTSRTWSPDKDGEISVSSSFFLGYKIYNSSPQNVVVACQDASFPSDELTLVSFYLEPF